ncbi:MAG: O-antigen ligase family protein [Pseudomonadota bacterium]
MRGALSGGAGAVARRGETLVVVALVPVGWAVLHGGGSRQVGLAWVGLAALVALAALAWTAPRPRLGRDGVLLLGGLGGLVAWQGLTLLWSIEADRTWETFNRGLVYVAFVLLGTLAVGAAGSPRVVAAALAGLLGVAVVWALVTVAVPAVGPDTERSARLQEPVGYWNGLALLVAVSLPLWLWLASRRGHPPRLRAGAAAMLFLALVALALTASRGGILAALAAVGVWLVVGRPRLESAAALALAGVPAVAVAAVALEATVLGEAGELTGERKSDGLVFGALALVGAAAVFAAALRLSRLSPGDPLRRRLGRALLAAGAVAGVVALVLVLATVDLGAAWDDFRNPPEQQVTQGAGRVTAVSSNHRWTWWTQAWDLFRDHPLEGTGAGSYELARRAIRQDTSAPLDPHDLPLAALAETGIVGLALLLAAVAGGAWAAAAAVRRLGGDERASAAALAAGAAAWLVQSLVDMPWQYVAVTGPVLFALGALAGAGREAAPPPHRLLPALAAGAALAAAAFSIVSPALAETRTDAAFDALVAGDPGSAVDRARQARGLDPLAVEPVIVQASAEEIRGNLDEAERLFRRAVELQPENPQTWYELGRFEFETRRRPATALVYADRSWGLDRRSPDTGTLLDRIRAALAAGG